MIHANQLIRRRMVATNVAWSVMAPTSPGLSKVKPGGNMPVLGTGSWAKATLAKENAKAKTKINNAYFFINNIKSALFLIFSTFVCIILKNDGKCKSMDSR